MLSCPRCGTGNLKEGRSLSMHLTRYCSSPSLLFHAQRGTLAKNCSHELMLSGSCSSTYWQQIRNFNSLMANVSVPMINTLHGVRNTICLPPDIAFQVHLLSQMNTHRGNDLNMFNEVIQCVKAHAIHYNMDYTTLQILSRKQLVHLLTKYSVAFSQANITFSAPYRWICCYCSYF